MLPPSLTYRNAAANPAVITTTLVVLAVGAVLVLPSIAWLLALQRRLPYDSETRT
jgi:cytochrome d ubiquinol oxidase subunit II